MATNKKEAVVTELTEKFKNAHSIFLASFEGLDVERTTDLRKNFVKENIEYRVVKNTLAKRALKNAEIEGLDEFFVGTTSVAFSNEDDPVRPGKVIKAFLNDNKEAPFELKACLFEGELYAGKNAQQVLDFASREDLIAKFAGMLISPVQKFAATVLALKESKE